MKDGEVRFRHGYWCLRCNEERERLFICHKCGAKIEWTVPIEEIWRARPVVWRRPSTWQGGHWELVGMHKED